MRINELKWKGISIWPPQWTEEYPNLIRQGVLKDIKILPLTDLIKIDAAYGLTIISGLLLTTAEYRGSLYNKLKENIGIRLDDVGNIEVIF